MSESNPKQVDIELADLVDIDQAMEYISANRQAGIIEDYAGDSGLSREDKLGARTYALWESVDGNRRALRAMVHCLWIPNGTNQSKTYQVIPYDSTDITQVEALEIKKGLEELKKVA